MRPDPSTEAAAASAAPGEVLGVRSDGVLVATGEGALRLEVVQPASKGRMDARAWANGYGIGTGVSLA
jgi:methionyl-tRNA formyltransferase